VPARAGSGSNSALRIHPTAPIPSTLFTPEVHNLYHASDDTSDGSINDPIPVAIPDRFNITGVRSTTTMVGCIRETGFAGLDT